MLFRYPAHAQDTLPALTNAERIRKLLLKETSGHYALGQKGHWHGGLHLTQLTHPDHEFEPVRAIADGKLIAWRFTEDYSTAVFVGDQRVLAPQQLAYSTCFCLLKHAFSRSDGSDKFEFYSLYMHLRPLKYQPGPCYRLKSNRTKRSASNLAQTVGTLTRNTQIECLPERPQTYKISGESYLMVKARISGSEDEPFWIALQNQDQKRYFQEHFERINPLPGQQCLSDYNTARDTTNSGSAADDDLVHILETPLDIKAGDPLGYLGKHQALASLEGRVQDKHQVHLEVFSTERPPAALFPADQGWAFLTNEVSSPFQLPEQNTDFLQRLLQHLGEAEATHTIPQQITRIHGEAIENGQLEKLIIHHPSEWHPEQERHAQEWMADIQGRVHAWVRDASRAAEKAKREAGYERSKANLELELERLQKLMFFSEVGLPEKVWHLHPIGIAAQLQELYENDECWLTVPEGQFTFDTEGNDNPDSDYFSRIAHATIGGSGITLGRGFDLYQQSNQAERLMREVGIDAELIEQLRPAIGLTGNSARAFFRENKIRLMNHIVTRKKQYDLYNLIYPGYLKKASDLYEAHVRSEKSKMPAFEELEDRIKAVLVDMGYRGDFQQVSYTRDDYFNRRLPPLNSDELVKVREAAAAFRQAVTDNKSAALGQYFSAYKDEWKVFWGVPEERASARIWFLKNGLPIPGIVARLLFPRGY